MKKITKLILIFVMFFGVIGCSQNQVEKNGEEVVDNYQPSTVDHSLLYQANNAVNFDKLLEDENYYYYKNIYDKGSLYRKDKQTGENIMLVEANRINSVIFLSLVDDKIYFIYNDDNEENFGSFDWNGLGLYSVNKDGSDFSKVLDEVELDYAIVDNYIYYIGSWFDGLHRYNIETELTETIVDDQVGSFVLEEQTIYYRSHDLSIISIDLNTMNSNELVNASDSNIYSIEQFIYRNGSLYFSGEYEKNEERYQQVFRYDIASNQTFSLWNSLSFNLFNPRINAMVASDDDVYFIVRYFSDDQRKLENNRVINNYSIYKVDDKNVSKLVNVEKELLGFNIDIQIAKDFLMIFDWNQQMLSTEYQAINIIDFEGNKVELNMN